MSQKTTQGHVFAAKGYPELCTDYKLLWELIFKGYRVPAWLVYTAEYDELLWDMVEVKQFRNTKDYMIGVRGNSYNAEQTYQDFEMVCQRYSLHFIKPLGV